MLRALDLESGEPVWETETRERFSVRKGWFGVASAPLVADGKVYIGNEDGYLSCATCHLDGGHDGRVWDFTGRGEGLRNVVMIGAD